MPPPEQPPPSPVKPSQLPLAKGSPGLSLCATPPCHPPQCPPSHRTYIVLDQLLDGVKLGAGGDVVAPVVQFPNLIVLHVVSLGLVPVPDGEGVGTYMEGAGQGGSGRDVGHSPPRVRVPVPIPFVVSLSRMRKVPLQFPWHRSCRSASLRPILPKYHLPRGQAQRREGTHRTPQPRPLASTAELPGLAGGARRPGSEADGVGVCLHPCPPPYSLFCLDRVHGGHVVAGDVTRGA